MWRALPPLRAHLTRGALAMHAQHRLDVVLPPAHPRGGHEGHAVGLRDIVPQLGGRVLLAVERDVERHLGDVIGQMSTRLFGTVSVAAGDGSKK